ncbi:MAG: hypothetical protein LBJ92_04400 [Holosporales bacterium]|jgi:hypothetical protein|nr:hypothetical protein [Holosporales bacterium]
MQLLPFTKAMAGEAKECLVSQTYMPSELKSITVGVHEKPSWRFGFPDWEPEWICLRRVVEWRGKLCAGSIGNLENSGYPITDRTRVSFLICCAAIGNYSAEQQGLPIYRSPWWTGDEVTSFLRVHSLVVTYASLGLSALSVCAGGFSVYKCSTLESSKDKILALGGIVGSSVLGLAGALGIRYAPEIAVKLI